MEVKKQAYHAATIAFLTSLSEARLQSKLIEPLLRLQGFTCVRNVSGANDKGKDLVAVKMELGKFKLYAIQIKKFRFSGKHTSTTSLTYATTQLQQVFSESVMDPLLNEKRLPDRCIFITPYAISRDAFESALHRVRELERREITIIDGPILADMVLKDMPEVLTQANQRVRYRINLDREANKIKESSAFSVITTLELDSIYVDILLSLGNETVEDIALRPVSVPRARFLLASKREVDQLKGKCQIWLGAPPPFEIPSKISEDSRNEIERLSVEIERRLADARTAIKQWEVTERSEDREYIRLRGELTKLKGQDVKTKTKRRSLEGQMFRLVNTSAGFNRRYRELWSALEDLHAFVVVNFDIGPLVTAVEARANECHRQILSMNDPALSIRQSSRIVRDGMKLTDESEDLKRLPIMLEHFPSFTMRSMLGPDAKRQRLSAAVLLKLDLPIFVTGPPGAGKTTLARRLAQTMVRDSPSLPIVLYLVDYQHSPRCNIVQDCVRELGRHGMRESEESLRQKIEGGVFRLFFDGLDEAGSNANVVLGEIAQFHSEFPSCPLLITARETLRSMIWRDALHIRIAPLNDHQLNALLSNWFTAEPTKLGRLRKWLLANERMREAARTPMIAALLCSLIHADADMPSTEIELYEQRFELLLGRWEQAKGIEPLTRATRTLYWHFMMALAFEMHEKGLRVIERQEAVRVAMNYASTKLHLTADAIVQDCQSRGLLETEGLGGISFGHLTYQEFLAGKSLAHHNPVDFILSHLSEPWWENPLHSYAALKSDISALLDAAANVRGRRLSVGRLRELIALAPITPKSVANQREVEMLSSLHMM
jgi:energy-coupling factor transporter ATP-binding protein EcfA2